MGKGKYILPLFCAALFIPACERDVDFKGNGHAPKMIVNSIVGANDGEHSIGVSESVFLFGNRKPERVGDATLRAHVNGSEVPVEYSYDGRGAVYYTFPASLSPGDKVELSGESPVHGRVSGADYVPFPAKIEDLKTEWFTGEKDEESYLQTLVTLADKPGEKNYYRILIHTLEKVVAEEDEWGQPGWETEYKIKHEVFVDREILFNNIGGGMLAGDEDLAQAYRIFSDELFDGKEYTLNVYIRLDRNPSSGGWFGNVHIVGRSVTVEIQTLSENYFKYLRSLELAMTENNFSEPVKIFSNMANGYGILGTYNVAEKTLELPLE